MSDAEAILEAARDNDVKTIRSILGGGSLEVNVANGFGQTALHEASLWGSLDAVKALLELGADVNKANSRGSTPLHFGAGARSDAMAICETLLEAGANPEAMDANGRLPFEMADTEDVRQFLGGPDARIFEYAAEGKAEELRQLLVELASDDSSSMEEDEKEEDKEGEEDEEEEDEGKEEGKMDEDEEDEDEEDEDEPVSLHVVDSEGCTPLNLAIASESLETVKVILEHDPTLITYPDMSGNTPLHAAVEVGNLEIIKYLLERQPPPEINKQNMHPSEYALAQWTVGKVPLEPYDMTPLHIAVETGNSEVVELLLATGRCDVNVLDFDKSSPLHLALEAEDEELVELLLRAGANADQHNPDFKSPLHLTASRGKISLLRLLLEVGRAKVASAVSDDGWTPLHLAARGGAADKVAALLAAGADVAAANNQGSTALHLAAVNGHLAVVQALLAAGAPKDVTNREGKRPLEVAKTEEIRVLLA